MKLTDATNRRIATVVVFNIYEDTNGLSIKFRAIVQKFLKDGHIVNLVIPRCDKRLLPVNPRLNVVHAWSVPFAFYPHIWIPVCWNSSRLVSSRTTHTTLVTCTEFMHLHLYNAVQQYTTCRNNTTKIHAAYCSNVMHYGQLYGPVVTFFCTIMLFILNVMLVLSMIDYVFVAGESSRQYFWTSNQHRVHVMNGVLVRDFQHTKGKMEHSYTDDGQLALHLLYCTRLSIEKNVFMLVDICHELKRRTTNHLRCTIIGTGRDRHKIQEYINMKDLTDNIHLEGFMEHTDLKTLYLCTKNAVYCSPSVSETFGQNIIEAGICGLPIFTNINIETKHMFKHAENAYIFSSVETCVDSLQSFVRLPVAARSQLIEKSTQNCQLYDLEASIDRYFRST